MNPTPGRPTVSFRGLLFSGQTHEFALQALAKRFPRYKESDRKDDPIVRGWTSSTGHFTSDRSLSAHPNLYPDHSKAPPLPPLAV